MICGTTFHFVDIDDLWPRIAARVARSRTDPKKLRDLRCRCHGGGDAICMEGPDGVLIVAAEPDALGNVTAMVLLAVSKGLYGAFKRQESAMLAIARDLGATELSFRTDRRGWGRLVGPQWHASGDRFTRAV